MSKPAEAEREIPRTQDDAPPASLPFKVRNPRYTGATPEDVARALFRPIKPNRKEEAYASVFTIHYPDEERLAARPLRTAPCYDRLKALGAVFGQKFGWERANWFAPEGVEPVDD